MMRLIIGSVGSSPLTRGTPPRRICEPRRPRFIPAYAGNSILNSPPLERLTVHPRLRGELGQTISSGCIPSGSSPLTRGTRAVSRPLHGFSRFIPAYAGNSYPRRRSCHLTAVHPRLRGELSLLTVLRVFDDGSSPLTRGTLFHSIQQHTSSRFIPAYAGNSLKMVTTLH